MSGFILYDNGVMMDEVKTVIKFSNEYVSPYARKVKGLNGVFNHFEGYENVKISLWGYDPQLKKDVYLVTGMDNGVKNSLLSCMVEV